MSQYSKFNLVYHLQKWMDSVPGQTFLNYGYSWGASIVILGALFKLTHLPGANIMLYFGMGTEVIVFFLSAFDRPFDKTDDGRELPTHIIDEENVNETETSASETSEYTEEEVETTQTAEYADEPEEQYQNTDESQPYEEEYQQSAEPYYTQEVDQVDQQREAVMQAQQQTPEMVEAQTNYVAALENLTEMLGKVSEQSERLTRDSEEMENLNRTLTGIARIYEMQLKGASQQIGTIEQVNEQTRKMAQQIEQLNSIYARMIQAMTINMQAAAPITPAQQQPTNDNL